MVNLDIWMLALIIISNMFGGYLFGYLYVGRKYSKRTKEIKTRDRVEELNGEILNTNVRVDEWLEKLRKDFESLEKRTSGSIHELRAQLDACNRITEKTQSHAQELEEKIEELYRLLDSVQCTVTNNSVKIYNQERAISDITEEVYGCHDLKAVLEHVSRIDDAEGDIHVLQERMKMLSQELKAFKDDANNRIENLQQRVHLNSNNIERNSEHCKCLFNISRDNLGEFKEQMDTIVQEIHDEMDKLQRRLDGLSDRLEKESCDLYNEIENNSESSMSAYGRLDERMNQMMNAIVEAAKEDDQETRDVAKELDDLKRSMGDITEEVYAYRDLTEKMDTQLMAHSVKFKDVAKDIEDLRRHSNEGTDKLIQIENEQERMGNRFSWMKTAIAKQLIQTNGLRDDIEAVGAVRQELTGKIKKLKKKLRRMEVGQTNGNQ